MLSHKQHINILYLSVKLCHAHLVIQISCKEEMRKRYSFLNNAGTLHCNLINRINNGDSVIDHEEILSARGIFYGIAIYEIKNGKIVKAWFP